MFIKDILEKNKNLSKIAIKHGSKKITYEELFIIVNKNKNILNNYTKQQDNIGIYLNNSIDYVIAYFTITSLDRVIVPIEVQNKKNEIESIVKYCELKLIITNTKYIDLLKNFLSNFEQRITLFNLDNRNFEEVGTGGNMYFNNSVHKDVNEDDVAIMLHTSGTTNNPKRVMLTHKNLIRNLESNIKSLKLTKEDVTLIALPMFFGYCNTAQLLTHLYLSASIVIMDQIFMPNKFFRIVEKEGITNFTGVPSMLLMLLNYKNKSQYSSIPLKYICFGGGTMPINKLKELIETFPNIGFVQTYGQTEASPRVTCLMPEDSIKKIGSVGKPIPDVKVRIVNEKGNDVGVHEIGEIIINGPNVMKGYYKRPEETNNVKKEGWLYSGDLGWYDEDGYIFLKGRKKNMLISGGINIYPEEIEELLMHHPAVKEVYVFGEKHEVLGEVPVAKVIIKNIITISEDELINYCLENLASYKAPRRIILTQELNKTATGKLRRC